jgi:hypothetical protein
MKRFLVKTALMLFPIVASGIIAEILIRNIPNDYSYKKKFLDVNSEKIQILFLGSSHAYYGIDPTAVKTNSFNASHISQSLDYDYEILLKYKDKLKQLRCIVIPIDYFTLSSKVSTGPEPWRVKNYEIYYQINKSLKISDRFEMLSLTPELNLKRIFSSYIKGTNFITCNDLGYGNDKRKAKDLVESGISAAERHGKIDQGAVSDNIRTLTNMAGFAKERSIKILIYTTPGYTTYVSHLDKEQLKTTHKIIRELVTANPHCKYYDLLRDSSFVKSDFRDADHLNQAGARKLTLKLNDFINSAFSE